MYDDELSKVFDFQIDEYRGEKENNNIERTLAVIEFD